MRLRTLPAVLAPLVLGTILAFLSGSFNFGMTILVVISAVSIQVGTNFANDYFDWKNGADTDRRVGPMRVTQAGKITPRAIWWGMVGVFGLAIAASAGVIIHTGWPILVIGIFSIAMGILYTGGPKPLGYMGLGDVLVFIFFGPVATAGTYYVNTLSFTWTPVFLGAALGCMATAILVVNNLRDVVEDRSTGKNTLVVRFGESFGRWEYGLCMVGAVVISWMVAVLNGRIWAAVAAGIVGIVGIRLTKLVVGRSGAELDPLLGQTGCLLVALAIGLSLGWVIG